MSQESNEGAMTGAKIKEIRQKNGLSQQEFGARLGVSHAHISKIESGKENPSDTLLKLIGYEFGMDKVYGIPAAEETKPKIKQYLSMIEDLIINTQMGDGSLYNTEFMLAALLTIYQETNDSEKYRELLLESIAAIIDEVSIVLSRTNSQQSMKALHTSTLLRAKKEISDCCKNLFDLLDERA